MHWKFWKKPSSPKVCDHLNCPSPWIYDLDYLWMKDGHHTSCMLLRCSRCNSIIGFPDDNLRIAIKKGTPETLCILEKCGVDIGGR
jgi:hypothetical protein